MEMLIAAVNLYPANAGNKISEFVYIGSLRSSQYMNLMLHVNL